MRALALTDPDLLARRIHPLALLHYARAVERSLDDLAGEVPAFVDCHLQASLAIFPRNGVLVEVHCQPPVEERVRERIRSSLESLARPALAEGPVALAVLRSPPGGSSVSPLDRLPPPFSSLLPAGSPLTDASLVRAAGLGELLPSRDEDLPPPRGRGALARWWQTLRDCFFARRDPERSAWTDGSRRWAPLDLEAWAQAAADRGEATAEGVGNPAWHVHRAAAEMDHGRWASALSSLDAALAADPHHAKARRLRALVRRRAWLVSAEPGDGYGAILADVNAAIWLDPSHAPALFDRANLLCHLGRIEEALRDYDRLVELCPQLGAAWSARGTAKIQLGDFAGGSEDFRRAIACEPPAADGYRVQRWLVEAAGEHRREDYERAVAAASAALEIDSQSLPARVIRGTAHWHAEQLVEAIDDFDWLIAHGGDAFATHLARGQVLAEQGEFKAALADLNRAITLRAQRAPSPELGRAHAARGLARAALGNLAEADHDFERAASLCPGSAWLHYNRGLRFDLAGDRPQAVACFQQALRAQDPPLTARKRRRAAGYLRRFGEPQPAAPSTG